jgi:hypothetical protein
VCARQRPLASSEYKPATPPPACRTRLTHDHRAARRSAGSIFPIRKVVGGMFWCSPPQPDSRGRVILSARDLFVQPGVLPARPSRWRNARPHPRQAALTELGNVVFMAPMSRCGSRQRAVWPPARRPAFGRTRAGLTSPAENEFERGVRSLGDLLPR